MRQILTAGAALFLGGMVLGAESADELIKKGDVFYEKLDATESLKFYLPAEKLEPNNARLLVKISREYRHLMSDATGADEKRKLGDVALGFAQRAVALAPEDAETQLALAITYGKLLSIQPLKEKAETSRRLKAVVDKAIKLDPRNDLGWHILGRWYMGVADVNVVTRALASIVYGKMPEGTNEDAVRCFEKAIALNPNRLMHYIELGRTFERMGRKAEARKFITKGLAMRETEKDDAETKRRGREVLAKLR